MESSSNTSYTMTPKNPGTFSSGDPLLAKLQEIDCDLRKFEKSLIEIPGSEALKWMVSETLGSLLEEINSKNGSGPDGAKESSPSKSHLHLTSPLQDISNTMGSTTKVRPKVDGSLKAKPKGASDTARVSMSDLKRPFPPHNDADTQSQKRRAVVPHVSFTSKTFLALAVP